MSHVVLLGDSIFDNASYVAGGEAVIRQLRRALPEGWRATLLAVDGATTANVHAQYTKLPPDATHLVLSAGGNDALMHYSTIMEGRAAGIAQALDVVGGIGAEFQRIYRRLLERICAFDKPTAVCTIYDSVPDLDRAARTALCVFNDVILREAALLGVPVVDLRLVCAHRKDYSEMSPIEPSSTGGEKIARAIARLVTRHDFATGGCGIYS